MKTKTFLISILLSLSLPLLALGSDNPFVGYWQTIDDETGKPRSIVHITQKGDELRGKIIDLIDPDEPNPKCDQCPGDKKDQPIIGLEIIWGLKEKTPGKEWDSGHILDPENGRVYKSRLRLVADGQELNVRGFVGFSLIGRSQIWHRTEKPSSL